MNVLLLLLATAMGAIQDDLVVAANPELPEAARMEAFQRLVQRGSLELEGLRTVATQDASDARQRWVAVRVLGKVGGPRARDILLEVLGDEMPAMRSAAVSALGDLGDKNASDDVAARLADPAIMVRAAAAEALGKLRDPSTVPALVAALEDRSNYHRGASLWVRSDYVEALGRIRDPAAVPALGKALDDADPDVAAAAVAALEGIAGFSMGQGRDVAAEREAWRRWIAARKR